MNTYVMVVEKLYKASKIKFSIKEKYGKMSIVMIIIFLLICLETLSLILFIYFSSEKIMLVAISHFCLMLITYKTFDKFDALYGYSELQMRRNSENMIECFSNLLNEYGFTDKAEIDSIISTIQTNLTKKEEIKCKRKEKKFKYFATIWITALAFFGKEFWAEMKIAGRVGLDLIVEIITYLVMGLILWGYFQWLMNIMYKEPSISKEEKMVQALEEVKLFREGKRLFVTREIMDEEVLIEHITKID